MKKPHTLLKAHRRAPVVNADPDLLPVNPRTKIPSQFIYVHYESSWEFDHDHGWLPRLSRLIAMPGVNGVGRNGELQGAINRATAKGGTIIYDDDQRLLRKGESPDDALFFGYGRFFPCSNGAKWWVDPGQVPTVTPSGRILWNEREASRIYASFRAHIRDSGIVQPMHHLTLAEHLDAMRNRIDNLRARVGRNPHLAAALQEAEETYQAMLPTRADEEADRAKGRKLSRPKRKTNA